jgi:hypothetical protein
MGNELGYKPFSSSTKFISRTIKYKLIDEKGEIIKQNKIKVKIPKTLRQNIFDDVIRFIDAIIIRYVDTVISSIKP